VSDARLIVGNDERDDAAVYDLGDGSGVISTTDFFTPVVDDAYDFGRIASVNAFSDVWAMGGAPLMAIGILGWPIDKLPAELANRVIEGARSVCSGVGVVLAGGHSIDNPEPIFGLSVTGRVQLDCLKRNSGGQPGDRLLLTKPLGTGILTTALKRGLLDATACTLATNVMLGDNRIGVELASMPGVHAMTDITGFGLLGHAREMALGAGLAADIDVAAVPLIDDELLQSCLELGAVPGGTQRNWDSYGPYVGGLEGTNRGNTRNILCDPQTAGGLLIAADPESVHAVTALGEAQGLSVHEIGSLAFGDSGTLRVHTG